MADLNLEQDRARDEAEVLLEEADLIEEELLRGLTLAGGLDYFPPGSSPSDEGRGASKPSEPPKIVRNIIYNFNSDVKPASRRRFVTFLEDARRNQLHFKEGEAFVMKLPEEEYGPVATWRRSSVLQVKPEETDVVRLAGELATSHGLVIIAYDEDQIFLADASSKPTPPTLTTSPATWLAVGTVVGVALSNPVAGVIVAGVAVGTWAWRKLFQKDEDEWKL